MIELPTPSPTPSTDWLSLRSLLRLHVRVTSEHVQGLVATTARGDLVRVDLTAGAHCAWIVVRAVICSALDMDPQLSLERNGTLAFAAVVLLDGYYLLRVAVPIDSVETRAPVELIGLVVAAAQSLCPWGTATPADAIGLFSHYTT